MRTIRLVSWVEDTANLESWPDHDPMPALLVREGETTKIHLTTKYTSGLPIDLHTGSPTLQLIIRDRCGNAEKTLTMAAVPSDGYGVSEVTISATDLRNLCGGRYTWEAKMSLSGVSTFLVAPSVFIYESVR